MAVKKTTAAKKTTTTKKPASKSAAKATTTKKSTAPKVDETPEVGAIADRLIGAVNEGQFDGYLSALDDAVSARMDALVASEKPARSKPAAKSSAAAKKVAPAPKKTAAAAKGEKSTDSTGPKVGESYKIKGVKGLTGATVKFVRFRDPSAKTKAVVEMVTSKPENPKGKKVVLPVAALVAK